jgi:hypothetical protein
MSMIKRYVDDLVMLGVDPAKAGTFVAEVYTAGVLAAVSRIPPSGSGGSLLKKPPTDPRDPGPQGLTVHRTG